MVGYRNHSGGCPGADMMWENEGKKYGVKTIAYSFWNHVHEGETPYVMSYDELTEGWNHIIIASKSLKRPTDTYMYPYVKNLLSRNWYQVKHAYTIFAVSEFQNKLRNAVKGGTGWAVQMAIDNEKPVYFFNQNTRDFGKPYFGWNEYDYTKGNFKPIDTIPILSKEFAGIGTRELNQFGTNAIKEIYKENENSNINILSTI